MDAPITALFSAVLKSYQNAIGGYTGHLSGAFSSIEHLCLFEAAAPESSPVSVHAHGSMCEAGCCQVPF